MKCKCCFYEWKISDTDHVLFCPFCQEPFIEVHEKFYDIESILLYLTHNYGLDMLLDKKTSLQFIKIFFPNGKREYHLMRIIYAANVVDSLYEVKSAPEMIQENIIHQKSIQLCEMYGVSADWAEYIIGCICKCFGMRNVIEQSIIKIRQKAEMNDTRAIFELAERYYQGKNIEKDWKKYLYWLELGAQKEYLPALYRMGRELWSGKICKRNEAGAISYLSKAVQLGDREAICFIASDKKLLQLIAIDISKLVEKIMDSQEQLSCQQLCHLGSYYINSGDALRAIDVAEMAYNMDPKIAWKVYVCALQTENKHKNKTLILNVLKDAAMNGIMDAAKILGQQYEQNAKSGNNMLTAMYWYRLVANMGDVDTQIYIAQIYEKGIKMRKDLKKAIYWYHIAAYNGSNLAKEKISYKSKDCIVQDLTIVFEDNFEMVCKVKKLVTYNKKDYLIVEDPESKEDFVVYYEENNSIEGYDIEAVDEETEKTVLQVYLSGEYA